MGPMAAKWLVDSQVAIARSLSRGDGIAEIESGLRKIIARDLPMANRNEAAALARSAVFSARMARKAVRDGRYAEYLTSPRCRGFMEKAANAMDRRLQVKAKARIAAETLEKGRSAESPAVFYAVSTHRAPREEHRDLQGTMAYDRMWKSALERSGKWYLAKAVGRMIRGTGMRSVQELMGPPCYVGTALYCHHVFVPLDTEEVLSGTANTVIYDGAGPSKSDARRYREYKRRRELVISRATPRDKKENRR